jgi:hypothetical protein
MTALAHAFSLALLHFVWQGLAVAILLWVALLGMRNRSAKVRYLLSCAAVGLLAVMPAVTTYLLYHRPEVATGAKIASLSTVAAAATLTGGLSWLTLLEGWTVPVWCAGVLLFSCRL